MTRREVVTNEVDALSAEFLKYDNIIIQKSSKFNSFLKAFGLEEYSKDIYFILFRKLESKTYTFLIFANYGFIVRDYEVEHPELLDVPTRYVNSLSRLFKSGWLSDEGADKFINFIDVEEAYYKDSFLYVELKDIEEPFKMNVKLVKEEENDDDLFRAIASLISNISISIIEKEIECELVYEEIDALFKEEKLEEVLALLNKHTKEDSEDISFSYYRAKALIDNGDLVEAQKQVDVTFSLFREFVGDNDNMEEWDDENHSFYAEVKELNSKVNYGLENYDGALWEINDAYFHTCNSDDKINFKKNREEVLGTFMEKVLELDFHKRKILYVENDLPAFKPETILPLRLNDMRSFVFPPSHPIKGELYVGHPFQPKYYYPLDEYEQLLFESQFVELNHLLQCLGANEIKSEHIKGALEFNESQSKRSNRSDYHMNQKAEGGNKLTSGNAENDHQRSSFEEDEKYQNNRSEMGKRMMSVQKFTPKKSPYIPNDLVWYFHNETWQKIAQQRLQGELDYYEMIISSKNVMVINEREKNKINSDYKSLVTGGYSNALLKSKGSNESERHAEAEKDITSALSKENTNEWKLIVTFAPLDQLSNGSSVTVSEREAPELDAKELKYIEDIKFAIEDDGVIDSDERRMLERSQARYKISDERAKELENELLGKSQFTAQEQEFIDEVRLILEHDGEIGEGDRRILLRLASRLDITEQRAEELHKHVMMDGDGDGDGGDAAEFTDEELQYIEELNFCLEEGPEISRSGRRLLDRTRADLDISIERAAEIEEIVQAKNR